MVNKAQRSNFTLFWPGIFGVTLVLYVLIIINLPFNQLNSTIFLFALIGFWSRLPGVGIPTPLYILYFADVIDFFSVIIAVNVGPWEGATFSLIINLASRACGGWPRWDGVLKDTWCQYVACLVTPWLHVIGGGNYEFTLVAYTVIRALLFLPTRIIPDGTPFIEFLIYEMLGASAAMILVNIFYSRFFGDFFDAMLKQGIDFNWGLFLLVTIGILFLKRKLYGKAEEPLLLKIVRSIARRHRKKQKSKRSIMPDKIELEDGMQVKHEIGLNGMNNNHYLDIPVKEYKI